MDDLSFYLVSGNYVQLITFGHLWVLSFIV